MALGRRGGAKVIAVLGDGSTLYSVQGLWNARQRDLNICFVIINNRRYEALVKFGRHFGIEQPVGTQLPGVDFRAIASGFGLQSHLATNAVELDAALTAAFDSRSPTLVEAIVV
jgi:benzoylformate decarboxylase